MPSKGYGLSVTVTFIVCLLGLYGTFLTWSVLHERINTRPYGFNAHDGKPDFFKASMIVSTVQSLFAALIGGIYYISQYRASPFTLFTENTRPVALNFAKGLILVSLTSTLSSPLAYESLQHVDYLLYLLAKSCKLLPVMFVHKIFYGTKFPFYKYVVAGLVTTGVVLFSLSQSKKSKKTAEASDEKLFLGIVQLLGSMLLDGLTNSTQDQLFKTKVQGNLRKRGIQLNGISLMCLLNLFIFVLSFSYIMIFRYEAEFKYTINFIHHYPVVLKHMLEFSICGSLGQVFVFQILEKFGSLILITSTVTRKMFSMILSVVLFGHKLSYIQWMSIFSVFSGIGYEAALGYSQKKSIQEKKKN